MEIAVAPKLQDGPTCLVAAALSALSAHEAPDRTVRSLARLLPVWPDGVDWYDLAVQLEKEGFEARLSTGPPEAIARLLEAGFPVVALTTAAGRPHAVTIHGVTRSPDGSGACAGAPRRLLVMDPRLGTSTWRSSAALKAQQSEGRLLVIYRPEDRDKLGTRGFPVSVADRVDRRLRAQALMRRAEGHATPNAQALALLRRAVEQDPCWAPPRQALTVTAQRLGRPDLIPPSDATCPNSAGVTP